MSNTTVKSYQIDGTTFELRPLVYGQWRQLNSIIDGMPLPLELTPRNLIAAFADELHQIMAVILTESGKSPGDKDLEELAHRLEFAMPEDQVAEVLVNFFECNPIASVLNLINRVVAKLKDVASQIAEMELNKPLSPLAEATGLKEKISSGAAPRKKQNRG